MKIGDKSIAEILLDHEERLILLEQRALFPRRRIHNLRPLIIDVLKKSERPMKVGEIVEALGEKDRHKLVNWTLCKMADAKRIARTGRGEYEAIRR